MKDLIVDLKDPRFTGDKYGFIEELRSQSFYASSLVGRRGVLQSGRCCPCLEM